MQAHHAYLYEGPLSLLPALADSACALFSFERENNPDVSVREWEKFGIDESRELSALASLKSASGRQLFVLGVSSMTSEAQQALLKLFEEPQEGAVFVLLAPHGSVLPTLRSRFLPYPKELASAEAHGEVASFLGASYAERSKRIAELLDDEDGVRERVRNFMNELEALLYARLGSGGKDAVRGLSDLARFRGYLSDKAPSLKMILEHFAATLQQTK